MTLPAWMTAGGAAKKGEAAPARGQYDDASTDGRKAAEKMMANMGPVGGWVSLLCRSNILSCVGHKWGGAVTVSQVARLMSLSHQAGRQKRKQPPRRTLR